MANGYPICVQQWHKGPAGGVVALIYDDAQKEAIKYTSNWMQKEKKMCLCFHYN
jgi:hypothetical protein